MVSSQWRSRLHREGLLESNSTCRTCGVSFMAEVLKTSDRVRNHDSGLPISVERASERYSHTSREHGRASVPCRDVSPRRVPEACFVLLLVRRARDQYSLPWGRSGLVSGSHRGIGINVGMAVRYLDSERRHVRRIYCDVRRGRRQRHSCGWTSDAASGGAGRVISPMNSLKPIMARTVGRLLS